MPWRKKIGIFPWHQNNRFQLLRSGAPFFNTLLDLIESASVEIHLQVYIFEPDVTGRLVKNALLQAAERGVKIYLFMDAYGSGNFPEAWEKELKTHGAEINYFSRFRLIFMYHIGLRLHHKIFLFDRKTALIGGINISDHYSHLSHQTTWLDYGIKAEGSVVTDLLRICLTIERGLLPLPKAGYRKLQFPPQRTGIKARVLQNHWSKAKFGISRQYRQHIRNARKEIVILASYFVPSPALKRLLKKAAIRGVRVQLVLGGKSDVGLARYASHFLYHDLMKAGVEIWEWQPSVLHAKLAIIDEEWVCIGSYNLNYLSDFGSVECNIEIIDKGFAKSSLNEVNDLLKANARLINALDYLNAIKPLTYLRDFLSYRLFSFALKALFFLQRNK